MVEKPIITGFLTAAAAVTATVSLNDVAIGYVDGFDVASAWVSGIALTTACMIQFFPRKECGMLRAKGKKPSP